MDSRTGKKIRLGRLFDSTSKRCVIVAYSHGILLGPQPGMRSLQDMQRVTRSLARAQALMVTPGMVSMLEGAFIGKDKPSLIVQVDYQSFSRHTLEYAEAAATAMAQIEEVAAAGADGVMSYLYMGYADPEREKMEIARNSKFARACERWGIALMIEPRSAREKRSASDKSDPEVLGFTCRVAAELGADLVKCIHPGSLENLEAVIQGCPVPVLVAGGARAEKAEDAYQRAHIAMQAGAAGLVYGRNIYEAADPASELDKYLEIVHGSATSAPIGT
jgi:fructose-bisphosphate aldolase, class I